MIHGQAASAGGLLTRDESETRYGSEPMETSMHFIDFIKSHAAKYDLEDLARKLGYIEHEKGVARLKSVIGSPLLELNAENAYFDGLHGSQSIINFLLNEFHAEESMKIQALQDISAIMAFTEQCKADRSYMLLHADIDHSAIAGLSFFTRMGLGLSEKNNIRNITWLYNKPAGIQVAALSNIIREHYRKAGSESNRTKPVSYHFHYRRDLPAVDFDVDGHLVGPYPEMDERQLIIDGRDMAPMIRSGVEVMSDQQYPES